MTASTDAADLTVAGATPPHRCDTGDFDRTVCPEPCGRMHSYCTRCGARQDPCPHDDQRAAANSTDPDLGLGSTREWRLIRDDDGTVRVGHIDLRADRTPAAWSGAPAQLVGGDVNQVKATWRAAAAAFDLPVLDERDLRAAAPRPVMR